MNRRDYIKASGAIAGYTFLFGGVLTTINGCKTEPELDWTPQYFTNDEAVLVADIAERIIPKTDTPGAKEALVDRFIDASINNNFNAEQQQLFRTSLSVFDEKSREEFNKKFVDLTDEEQDGILQSLADEAGNYDGEDPHIFDVLKSMTVLGFFTSDVGARSCLVYDPIPGSYQGCVDYSEVGGVWAL